MEKKWSVAMRHPLLERPEDEFNPRFGQQLRWNGNIARLAAVGDACPPPNLQWQSWSRKRRQRLGTYLFVPSGSCKSPHEARRFTRSSKVPTGNQLPSISATEVPLLPNDDSLPPFGILGMHSEEVGAGWLEYEFDSSFRHFSTLPILPLVNRKFCR